MQVKVIFNTIINNFLQKENKNNKKKFLLFKCNNKCFFFISRQLKYKKKTQLNIIK